MVEERNADSSLSAAQQNLGEVRFPVSKGLADAAAALRTQGVPQRGGPAQCAVLPGLAEVARQRQPPALHAGAAGGLQHPAALQPSLPLGAAPMHARAGVLSGVSPGVAFQARGPTPAHRLAGVGAPPRALGHPVLLPPGAPSPMLAMARPDAAAAASEQGGLVCVSSSREAPQAIAHAMPWGGLPQGMAQRPFVPPPQGTPQALAQAMVQSQMPNTPQALTQAMACSQMPNLMRQIPPRMPQLPHGAMPLSRTMPVLPQQRSFPGSGSASPRVMSSAAGEPRSPAAAWPSGCQVEVRCDSDACLLGAWAEAEVLSAQGGLVRVRLRCLALEGEERTLRASVVRQRPRPEAVSWSVGDLVEARVGGVWREAEVLQLPPNPPNGATNGIRLVLVKLHANRLWLDWAALRRRGQPLRDANGVSGANPPIGKSSEPVGLGRKRDRSRERSSRRPTGASDRSLRPHQRGASLAQQLSGQAQEAATPAISSRSASTERVPFRRSSSSLDGLRADFLQPATSGDERLRWKLPPGVSGGQTLLISVRRPPELVEGLHVKLPSTARAGSTITITLPRPVAGGAPEAEVAPAAPRSKGERSLKRGGNAGDAARKVRRLSSHDTLLLEMADEAQAALRVFRPGSSAPSAAPPHEQEHLGELHSSPEWLEAWLLCSVVLPRLHVPVPTLAELEEWVCAAPCLHVVGAVDFAGGPPLPPTRTAVVRPDALGALHAELLVALLTEGVPAGPAGAGEAVCRLADGGETAAWLRRDGWMHGLCTALRAGVWAKTYPDTACPFVASAAAVPPPLERISSAEDKAKGSKFGQWVTEIGPPICGTFGCVLPNNHAGLHQLPNSGPRGGRLRREASADSTCAKVPEALSPTPANPPPAEGINAQLAVDPALLSAAEALAAAAAAPTDEARSAGLLPYAQARPLHRVLALRALLLALVSPAERRKVRTAALRCHLGSCFDADYWAVTSASRVYRCTKPGGAQQTGELPMGCRWEAVCLEREDFATFCSTLARCCVTPPELSQAGASRPQTACLAMLGRLRDRLPAAEHGLLEPPPLPTPVAASEPRHEARPAPAARAGCHDVAERRDRDSERKRERSGSSRREARGEHGAGPLAARPEASGNGAEQLGDSLPRDGASALVERPPSPPHVRVQLYARRVPVGHRQLDVRACLKLSIPRQRKLSSTLRFHQQEAGPQHWHDPRHHKLSATSPPAPGSAALAAGQPGAVLLNEEADAAAGVLPQKRAARHGKVADRVLARAIGAGGEPQYLVAWKGQAESDSTWEAWSSLENCDSLIRQLHAAELASGKLLPHWSPACPEKFDSDPELPGWRILARRTQSGRETKTYYGPLGEHARSKTVAVQLSKLYDLPALTA
ncbi:hypothetical protein EMIHUDRAFT_448412 [Emiliania huxleyi CCMP1516]|uniref:Chromo domain-containing protein n=2 Tax=Emiliania huxleyi TaxID=2903 RepID=A0A0D3IE89_EMIH1|nr:hypothetical protein EMIHUDRAFT_448412 [Emiliania huxleyi CCMP1516]EOD09574.1 hypothetical protein EMIHUDRAFT_448412 [Emiliania huxleyi CCMP1516]|eukprot:XP_005762003.1 hypothetical protein EMIHUDRAFT_448412 [Emiliania huxleyi CCMP1516]